MNMSFVRPRKVAVMLLFCSVFRGVSMTPAMATSSGAVLASSQVVMSQFAILNHAALYPHKRLHHERHHHDHSKHHKKHYSHARDPWHWGASWDSRWRKSVGIGWISGFYDPWRWNSWDKRHWNGRYIHAQRYVRPTPVVTPIKIIPKAAPLSKRTTHMAYDSGLHSLPANAKVVIRNNKPYYVWQGVTYQYDWSKERYMVVEDNAVESVKTQ
ncbi:hypothetical protein ACFOD0_04760 [Shewanella intestini]|uniref:RcnB family protein n=1 Tax=Shewanella intestini TaxID=2017544 RepID=A0ABS5I0R9_9GAMM|nr:MULTISPECIES: hypothetical protein [Shewanella]MBR9727612.1 hypothetical protein [Shewanella intestini]MRG35238.1 hypothetical protein [Shewanella sp. XMDDZSB0408]